MWRSIFFAFGLFVALWGGSLLAVDRMVLTMKEEAPQVERNDDVRGMFFSTDAEKNKVFSPPEWLAFSLMSFGTVTMLYAVALPRKHD